MALRLSEFSQSSECPPSQFALSPLGPSFALAQPQKYAGPFQYACLRPAFPGINRKSHGPPDIHEEANPKQIIARTPRSTFIRFRYFQFGGTRPRPRELSRPALQTRREECRSHRP